MGSCGDLASAIGPLSCGSEAADELVSEQLACRGAAQTSPDSDANADQVSSCRESEQAGIRVDCSPGDSDESGSVVLERDGQCSDNGGFECEKQSEADPSSLNGEGSSGEVGVENLENCDEKGLEASGIDCTENSPEQIEVEYGKCGDGFPVEGMKLVGQTADDLVVTEAGADVNPPLTVDGDECCNNKEATMECKMISEETVIATDGLLMNDQTGSCPSETCMSLVNEKVNHVAEVETDTCDKIPCPENSEMATENALSLGYPDGESSQDVFGLPFETEEEAVEANHAVGLDNLKLSPTETDGAADNLCPAVTSCPTFVEEEDGRSLKCLSLEEASVDMMRESITVAEVEPEICTEHPTFQVNVMPVEERTPNILQLNHEQMSSDNDVMAVSSLINGTDVWARLEADSQNGTSVSLLQEMPWERSGMHRCAADSTPLNEKKTDVMLSGVAADDPGTSEGSHSSSPLSNPAQLDGGEDSNVASETNVEHVGEENPRPLDQVIEDSCELHSKEIAVNCESLFEGSPDSTVKNCPLKSSNDLYVPSMVVAVATTSNAANGCPSETNDERKSDGRFDYVPDTESPVVVASSSRRRSRINKSGRKTQAKRASRYSRDISKLACHGEALEAIFKAAKKKRTCCSKTPRSSMWGIMQNISRHFEHMNEFGTEPNQNQGLQKVRLGQRSGKQSRNQSGGTLQVSKGNVGGSSNRIRLKLKMGNEVVMISEVVNTGRGTFASASCGGSISGVADLTNDVKKRSQLDYVGAKLKNDKSYSDDPLANGDSNLTVKESAQGGGGFFDPALARIESLGGTVEDTYLGSETSPDSEVINLMPEAQLSERPQEGAKDVALDSSKNLATFEEVLNSRKGKKKDKVPSKSSCGRKEKSSSGSLSSSKRRGCWVKVDENVGSSENFASLASANCLNNLSSNTESLHLSSGADLAFSNGVVNIENGANTFPGQDINIGLRDLEDLKINAHLVERKGHKEVKSSIPGKVSSGRSKELNTGKSRKGASCKQKKEKLTSKSKVNEKGMCDQFLCKAEDHALAGDGVRDSDLKNKAAACMWTGVSSESEILSNHLMEQHLPQRNAWVRCDDCHKWRRIAAALADSIEDTNSSWTCKDNLDKRFADCSIPQEMSNAEINAELEISDYSCEDDDYDGNQNYKELKCSRPTASQQSSFIQIDSNKFLHRSRKTQTIDEIMVCHCKLPLDGRLGCGDECLNRMLNIECVQGTCPCGDLCSNQQFQKRKYAKLQWFRCGKKGYGLQLREDVPAGEFIIEYVGEVLDIPAYEERQRDYAAKGHKHFYFMTLNGSEVIDACVKGNLGRFINHSCDPNCRTEKWMVNGEICIGLFATRDIKKGEEVTFDYNYVRVFGAAAKKCVCGSPQCRGYIGGDLQSTETIVQGDSDDEFPEPVMLHEDGDVACRFEDPIPLTIRGSDMTATDLALAGNDRNEYIREFEENTLEIKDLAIQSVTGISQLEKSLESGGRQGKVPYSKPSHQELLHSEDVRSKVASEFQQKISIEDASTLNDGDVPEMDRQPGRSVSDEKRRLVEARPLVKAPRASITVKKGKSSSNVQNVNRGQGTASKSQIVPIKPKKAIEGSSNGRFEAVQEKLNELLDADGGISKRKDAAKGYLKLLLLTAASGDSGNGEAIQSNRDLSMILDALLKTRSRIVLTDIINKNGLRMLHNIMKQYRRDFKKIPILRKLLKVLEYLAVREILTLEHINVGPPCPGMESFRESILSLTEHEDKQVHQIARNFRDRWIPRHLRKFGCADWDDGMSSLVRGLSLNFLSSRSSWRDSSVTRPVEASDCLHLPSVSATNSSATDNSSVDGGSTVGTRIRKRKSRWDSDTNPYLESLKHKEKEAMSKAECGRESNYEEEAPPGFSSPMDTAQVSSNGASTTAAVDQSGEKVQYMRCPFDAVIGQPQERFKSQCAVSYGVPLLILQQFGTPQAGSIENWAIAPGMPFQPFPPLPPYPRDRKRQSPPSSSDYSSSSLQSSADEKKPENFSQSTNGANLTDSGVPCSENQTMTPFKRLKGSSQDLGRRYFKQQKWNSAKMMPPWVRSWRNNPRGGTGPILNEQKSSDNSVDCKLGREDSNYHQEVPPVQNHHH